MPTNRLDEELVTRLMSDRGLGPGCPAQSVGSFCGLTQMTDHQGISTDAINYSRSTRYITPQRPPQATIQWKIMHPKGWEIFTMYHSQQDYTCNHIHICALYCLILFSGLRLK